MTSSETPADLVSPTKPEACALLMAVPLSEQQFATDVACPRLEYARAVRGSDAVAEAWERRGKIVATIALELADHARQLGVSVYQSAGPDDLEQACIAHPVVTLFAHWRGAFFASSDILETPAKLFARLRDSEAAVDKDIYARIPTCKVDKILACQNASDAKIWLAEALNESVINARKPIVGTFKSGADQIYVDGNWLRSVHRRSIDAACADLLIPGCSLELRDALHSPEEIAALIPASWAGIFDLGVCRSSYLAHILKAGRGDRRVITNRQVVVLQVRLEIQKVLYTVLSQQDINYAAALNELYILAAQGFGSEEPQTSLNQMPKDADDTCC